MRHKVLYNIKKLSAKKLSAKKLSAKKANKVSAKGVSVKKARKRISVKKAKKLSAKKLSAKKLSAKKLMMIKQRGGINLDELNEELINNAVIGDLAKVKSLIRMGADINAKDENGNTALMMSSLEGHLEIVKFLVSKGADVNETDNNGSTPLIETSSLEVVKFLVSKGADVNARNESGYTALLLNSVLETPETIKILEFLVSKGADVNTADNSGSTPLIESSKNGSLEIVKFLVSKSADVNKADNSGSTPLIKSSENGHLNIVKFLVSKGADIHAQEDAAIRLSSENRHFEVENFLLTHAPNLTQVISDIRNRQVRRDGGQVTPRVPRVPVTQVEEDSSDFISIQSNTESISNEEIKCTNVDVINMENYDTNSEDVFTIFYLNNLNKFSSNSCVSKNEMREYLKSESEEDPSLLTTIWKGGDKSGVGGKPTLKFIIKLPPNNVWITLGSFDRIMNSSIKKWYLLPLFGDKRRRIGYKYGTSANHGQIPGSKIYKAFTKEEILSGIVAKETDSDYPLYFKDFTIQDLSNGIKSDLIIKTIKNHFNLN
jgi:ankyrin repeat protein